MTTLYFEFSLWLRVGQGFSSRVSKQRLQLSGNKGLIITKHRSIAFREFSRGSINSVALLALLTRETWGVSLKDEWSKNLEASSWRLRPEKGMVRWLECWNIMKLLECQFFWFE